MGDFNRIRVCPISAVEKLLKDRGWRYRLTLPDDEGRAVLAEEQVLPECVEKPEANFVRTSKGELSIDLDDARWLRGVLDELIQLLEERRGEATAAPR